MVFSFPVLGRCGRHGNLNRRWGFRDESCRQNNNKMIPKSYQTGTQIIPSFRVWGFGFRVWGLGIGVWRFGVCMHIFICIYIYIYMYMCVCIYIYIYIYTGLGGVYGLGSKVYSVGFRV